VAAFIGYRPNTARGGKLYRTKFGVVPPTDLLNTVSKRIFVITIANATGVDVISMVVFAIVT